MLIINKQEHFEKVCDFAEKKALSPFLWSLLWRLHLFFDQEVEQGRDIAERKCDCGFSWVSTTLPQDEFCPSCKKLFRRMSLVVRPACRGDVVGKARTILTPDFAPASFSFVVTINGEYVCNGGLIYHGDQSGWVLPGGHIIKPGEGVQTYSVSFGSDNPWSIHT